jgi:hypothetical protein
LKKNNLNFLNNIVKFDFLENYVKSIKIKNIIKNLTIFKYKLAPLNLKEFFYDFQDKKIDLNFKNSENFLEKEFLNYINKDRLISRIFNLIFVSILFVFAVYKISFLLDSWHLFVSDGFIQIFYTILLMNKYLAGFILSIYLSFLYF